MEKGSVETFLYFNVKDKVFCYYYDIFQSAFTISFGQGKPLVPGNT